MNIGETLYTYTLYTCTVPSNGNYTSSIERVSRSSENLSSEFRARRVTNRVSYRVSSNAFACSSRLDNVSSRRDILLAMCKVKIKTISSPIVTP